MWDDLVAGITWDRFFPVVTLLLGYFGSLYAERRRDERDRSHAQLARHEEIELDALIELQDLLTRLPKLRVDEAGYHVLWSRLKDQLATAANEMDSDTPGYSARLDSVIQELTRERNSLLEALDALGGARYRAQALAARIYTDELRRSVLTGIDAFFDLGRDGSAEQMWSIIRPLNDSIGERLRGMR